jgi:hypothetical protein
MCFSFVGRKRWMERYVVIKTTSDAFKNSMVKMHTSMESDLIIKNFFNYTLSING